MSRRSLANVRAGLYSRVMVRVVALLLVYKAVSLGGIYDTFTNGCAEGWYVAGWISVSYGLAARLLVA